MGNRYERHLATKYTEKSLALVVRRSLFSLWVAVFLEMKNVAVAGLMRTQIKCELNAKR
jgi:hypothetical protein